MKVRPSIKRLGKGYFTRRKGKLVYNDKTKPRHKQRQG